MLFIFRDNVIKKAACHALHYTFLIKYSFKICYFLYCFRYIACL